MIGKTVSHYRILEKIGGGGMGVVCKAEDTELHHPVALKVLPDEFAKGHDRMARFKREAKVLASLNHPNIAAIYGLEEDGGKQALALERAEEGIRVNAAGPAVVEIPIYGSIIKPDTISKELKKFNEFHPIGRIGQPIDGRRRCYSCCRTKQAGYQVRPGTQTAVSWPVGINNSRLPAVGKSCVSQEKRYGFKN